MVSVILSHDVHKHNRIAPKFLRVSATRDPSVSKGKENEVKECLKKTRNSCPEVPPAHAKQVYLEEL